MTLNCVKLGLAVTFMKYLASVVSPKTWNKITFLASNLLNFAELVENELKMSISKNIYQYSFFQYCHFSLFTVKILRPYN